MEEITYPDGIKKVNYDYDDFGRLWHVSDWSGRVTTYTYDDASRMTRIDRPNNTSRVQEYDAAGQLRVVKEYKSNATLLAYEELQYDDDGRITSQFIHPKPAVITLLADVLTYDDDNQLSTWKPGDGSVSSVSYDADGNMTSGPLPSGTFGTYIYDSRNRLTSAGGSSYTYNPDGLRVSITGTGAATLVIDPNAALSRTLTRTKGGVTTYYVYGLGLLYEETSGAIKTYHYDHMGNTLAMASSGTTVSDTWSYVPFGKISARTGSTDTPFQFNGESGVQTDANGLYHMRARYYNPRLMRFVNADPIGFDGGINWYAFGENNPISSADPLGLKAVFSFSNGTSITVNNSQDFISTANSAESRSITKIDFFTSHANNNVQVIESNNSSSEHAIFYDPKSKGVQLYITHSLNSYAYTDVGSLLGDKVADGAEIILAGCNTASGCDNITKAVSEALPNTVVKGSSGETAGLRELLGSLFGIHPTGSDVTYENGCRL